MTKRNLNVVSMEQLASNCRELSTLRSNPSTSEANKELRCELKEANRTIRAELNKQGLDRPVIKSAMAVGTLSCELELIFRTQVLDKARQAHKDGVRGFANYRSDVTYYAEQFRFIYLNLDFSLNTDKEYLTLLGAVRDAKSLKQMVLALDDYYCFLKDLLQGFYQDIRKVDAELVRCKEELATVETPEQPTKEEAKEEAKPLFTLTKQVHVADLTAQEVIEVCNHPHQVIISLASNRAINLIELATRKLSKGDTTADWKGVISAMVQFI